MRNALLAVVVLSAALLGSGSAHAQTEKRFKVDKTNGVQVGFQNTSPSAAYDAFKAGMWTPVLVTLQEDEEGEIRLPMGADKFIKGEILVETADNDGVVNSYPQEFTQRLDEGTQSLRVLAYTKVGSRGPDIKVIVKSGDQTYPVWSKS